MLLPIKQHSFWLPTRSHEVDSVAPSVDDFYSFSQIVRRAREIKTLGCFFLLRVLKQTSRWNLQRYGFFKPNVTEQNRLFFKSKRCLSEDGKGRRKLIVTGCIRCTAYKFASTLVTHRSTVPFESFSGFFQFIKHFVNV